MKTERFDPSEKPAAGRRRRIEELLRRCQELTGGAALHWNADQCPPEVVEAFLERVVAFEQAPRSSLFERLSREGCRMPRPDSLSDKELPGKIREIALALAKQGFYLERTDHLDNRELYEALWDEASDGDYEEVPVPGGRWRLDMAAYGAEDELTVYLRYYADEADRLEWLEEFPDFELPEPRELPFDRDRFLPKPPGEG